MRVRFLALALLVVAPSQAAAERQVKPFIGATAGGSTTFVDLDHVVGDPKLAVGVSGMLLGEVLGVEGDLGRTPGFFQAGGPLQLITQSSVTTLTGNVVIAMPRRLSRYTLRLYFVGGAGMMHVKFDDVSSALKAATTLPALDLGGGATGFLTNEIGLNWDVRHFRSFAGSDRPTGITISPPEQLSFWRATMGLVIRY